MTAHRKNGTGTARPVLSLGTGSRKPRTASRPGAPAARGAPTIKVKRTARTAAASGSSAEPAAGPHAGRRLAPAAAAAPPPPSALKKRRAAAIKQPPAKKPAAQKPVPKAAAKEQLQQLPTADAAPETLTAPELSERQRRHLRGLAHALKPLVRLGSAGLTPAVAKETARALADHELIKVKAQAPDRQGRDALLEELARLTGSALVHRIGHIGVLYRPRPGLAKILIPD